MNSDGFGTRLRAALDQYGPLCVGIDPHASLLKSWGLPDDVTGLREFSLTVVDALGGQVAALKPQSAFFERFGSAGVAVLEQVIAACRAAGTLCIVDAKRGDIGSTMAGYADAYLAEGSPLAGDAVTISPYLGFGSLEPVIDLAIANGRGVFVLCLTSNPEGASVQHAVNPVSGLSVASQIAAAAGEVNRAYLDVVDSLPVIAGAAGVDGTGLNSAGFGQPVLGQPGAMGLAGPNDSRAPHRAWRREDQIGPLTIRPKRSERWHFDARSAPTMMPQPKVPAGPPMGPIGLVVGATIGDAAAATGTDLVGLAGPILAPGVGAQGGGAAELRQVFGAARRNVLASSSREILGAGPVKADLLAAAQRAAAQAAAALAG